MPVSLLVILAAAAQTPPPSRACGLIWPVAPDAQAAQRIAEAVIAADPHPSGANYFLEVLPDQADPAKWRAFQIQPHRRPIRPLPPGSVLPSRTSGGIEMRIDRCTGAISGLHYTR